jgi:hypothetical protein
MSQTNGGVTAGPVYSIGPDGPEELRQTLARSLTPAEQHGIFGGGSTSQPIGVESIRRLDVKPGETLVVTLPEGTRREDWTLVRDALTEYLPDGAKLLVVSGNVDLGVISADPCRSVPA